jgi:hypothetical protein
MSNRKKSLISSLACIALATLLSACGAPGGRQIAQGVTVVANDGPVQPGKVRFSLKNPNPEKWTARVESGSRDGTVRTGYTCKVLSCPEPATVVISRNLNRGPKPDKAALDKMAKETLPKLTQAQSLQVQVRTDNKAKIDTVSSTASKFGTYDGILNETKTTIGNNSRYTTVAVILAGRMLVTVRAEAGDRVTARKAVDEFSKSFTVEEGVPL